MEGQARLNDATRAELGLASVTWPKVVAFVMQRMTTVIGFTALATLAAIDGGDGRTIALAGLVGALGGTFLAWWLDYALATVARNESFKYVVYVFGVAGGMAVGIVNRLAVLS